LKNSQNYVLILDQYVSRWGLRDIWGRLSQLNDAWQSGTWHMVTMQYMSHKGLFVYLNASQT